MKISKVTIKNYRGIANCTFDASSLACLIGENNAGKSSVLLAISLFFSGSNLSAHDYYDSNEKIYIELEFNDIRNGDFQRLTSEQADRIRSIVHEGTLHLVRVYETSGKSTLKCKRLLPDDVRLNSAHVANILQGMKGDAIKETLVLEYPEYASNFEGIKSIKAAKEKMDELLGQIQGAAMSLQTDDLPTGFDNSIKNLLPEPIFITAVKDFKDDVKHKETTSFGRLMGILLGLIESDRNVQEAWDALDLLYNSLNKALGADGISQDNRLEQIKDVEQKITQILNDYFACFVL